MAEVSGTKGPTEKSARSVAISERPRPWHAPKSAGPRHLRRSAWLGGLALAWGCAASGAGAAPDPVCDPGRGPERGEVPLEAGAGWNAFLLLDAGEVGVWTVGAHPVFPQYATPEVVALDDEGRCHVLVSYSGKWTDLERVHDGGWLGGLAHGDVDPRIEGAELYVGGERGNLYQLVAHPHGALDARLIAHLPGREIHTLVAPVARPARELLVFTRPGALYRVTPTGEDGRFETVLAEELGGRVRDAVVLDHGADGSGIVEIVTGGRHGELRLLSVGEEGVTWEDVARLPVGIGRLAAAGAAQAPTILYAGLDDGRVLRLARTSDGWTTETVYAGPQGLRGLVAGRFDADPRVETLAVFGYGAEVVLLSRRPGQAWENEVLFTDRDRGHWLAVAELDGRNATEEILGSGYGGRVFLLTRPPRTGAR